MLPFYIRCDGKKTFYIRVYFILVKKVEAQYVTAKLSDTVKPIYKRKQVPENAFYNKLYFHIKKVRQFV